MLAVRDLHGRPKFYLDGDLTRARDVNGKPVASRASGDATEVTLADRAAAHMHGRQVLMDLAPGDVVYPAAQADFGIPDGEFVADIVSPVRTVQQDRGFYWVENVADGLELVTGAGADTTGEPALVDAGFAKTAYTCQGYALATRIPRQVSANADMNLKVRALRRLVDALRRLREARLVAMLTNAANWAVSNQVNVLAANKWNGGGGAVPLMDLFSALAKSYLPANTLVLPENVAPYFHVQAMQTFLQAGGELPRVLYARSKSAVGGAPAYLWAPTLSTSNVALVRLPSDPSNDIPTTTTLRWLGDGQDGVRREGILVREFFVREDNCDWLVCTHNDIEVQVSGAQSVVGALIVGATQ